MSDALDVTFAGVACIAIAVITVNDNAITVCVSSDFSLVDNHFAVIKNSIVATTSVIDSNVTINGGLTIVEYICITGNVVDCALTG